VTDEELMAELADVSGLPTASKSPVPDDIAAERMTVCFSCDRLKMLTCMECECAVATLARSSFGACPVGKWRS
jgi:hypothetical protein